METINNQKIKKLKDFKKAFKQKVPIWIIFKKQKKSQKPFAIDFQSTFYQFQQNMKAKYLYQGLIGNKTLFFYILQNKKQGVLMNNQNIKMQQLYNLYKSNQGWLQIIITQDSGF